MSQTQTVVQPPQELDGRRRRSLDSRAQIVAALFNLVREGDISPSAERVAARAQVGLRTVFRHFNDMDSLYRELSALIEAELAAALATPLTGSDWRARLIDLIGKRAVVYEKIAPFKRAANAHRHQSDFLVAGHQRMVATARDVLVELLPRTVHDDAPLMEMLDLLLSFESWSRLRDDQSLSPRDARDCLELAVRRLIDTAT